MPIFYRKPSKRRTSGKATQLGNCRVLASVSSQPYGVPGREPTLILNSRLLPDLAPPYLTRPARQLPQACVWAARRKTLKPFD